MILKLCLLKDAKRRGAKNIGAAIGVSGDYVERAHSVISEGANIICIDVAHGHHSLMRHALEVLRKHVWKHVHTLWLEM